MKEDELNKKIIEYEATFKKQAEVINTLNDNQKVLIKEVDALKVVAEPPKEEVKDGKTE